MENLKSEIEKPLSPIEEYYPDWDYNPGELLKLAVWHKKELPNEATEKIQIAIDDVLGKRKDLPGQWTLDENEFMNLIKGYAQCQTVPKKIEDGIIEVIKHWKRKNKN